MSKVYMGVEPAGGFASELPHNSDPDGHSEATRGVLGQVDERGRQTARKPSTFTSSGTRPARFTGGP